MFLIHAAEPAQGSSAELELFSEMRTLNCLHVIYTFSPSFLMFLLFLPLLFLHTFVPFHNSVDSFYSTFLFLS
jgi:hypothetical protein